MYYFLKFGGLRGKSIMKIVKKFVKKFGRKEVLKNGRMGVTIFLIMISFLSDFTTRAAGEFRVAGGRASGLSGISVALSDGWSAANNQAGSAFSRGIFCGVFFENRFLLRELSNKTLVFAANTKPGVFSVVFSHFGSTVYSELKTGLGYARKFGKNFSAGVQLDYYRFNISGDYGTANLFDCEAGLLFWPLKQMSVGFHCLNPVPVKISESSGGTLPALFRLGLCYWFTDDILVSAEIEKGPESKARGKLGAECRFAGILYARAGVSTGPFSLSIGAGIIINRICIDFATEYNQALGFSPAVSVQYQVRK